jgi:hypothetical protein
MKLFEVAKFKDQYSSNSGRISCAEYGRYFLLFNAKGREFVFYTITKVLSGNIGTL